MKNKHADKYTYKLAIKQNQQFRDCYYYNDFDMANSDYWMVFDMEFNYSNEVEFLRVVGGEYKLMASHSSLLSPTTPEKINICKMIEVNKRFNLKEIENE